MACPSLSPTFRLLAPSPHNTISLGKITIDAAELETELSERMRVPDRSRSKGCPCCVQAYMLQPWNPPWGGLRKSMVCGSGCGGCAGCGGRGRLGIRPNIGMTETANCMYCFQPLFPTTDRRVDYCPNCERSQWHRPKLGYA